MVARLYENTSAVNCYRSKGNESPIKVPKTSRTAKDEPMPIVREARLLWEQVIDYTCVAPDLILLFLAILLSILSDNSFFFFRLALNIIIY
jgi:hypothetical protein